MYNSTEAKDVEILAEKNRRIGRRWRDLDDEAKSKYYTAAKKKVHVMLQARAAGRLYPKFLDNERKCELYVN